MAETTLAEYLKTRDAPCPGCGVNLRGQLEDICPRCHKRLFLGELRALHHVFGDAKKGQIPRPEHKHAQRIAAYLADNKAPCPGCYRNLHKQEGTRCPACLKQLYYGELVSLHHAYGDSKTAPMPEPGSPESRHLDAYLSKYDASCFGCGYQLHGLKAEQCPECGRRLSLHEFIAAATPPTEYAALASWMTTLSMLPIGMVILGLFFFGFVGATSLSGHVMVALLILVAGLVGYLYVGPFRRMIVRQGWWALAFNPVSAIVMLYYSLMISELVFESVLP